MVAHERFLSHHGQRTARLCRDQSVHGDAVGRRTWLMWLISPPLFFAPNVHLERLEKMTIDQIVNRPSWQRLLDELTSEWREFILYVSVTPPRYCLCIEHSSVLSARQQCC